MLDWFTQKQQNTAPFYIESSPEVVETSSNISVTCYSSPQKQAVIPCRFDWFRTRNQVTFAIPNVKGSAYMCEPSDVNSIVKVQITSLDEEFPGKAVLHFGPIKMDLYLKKSLDKFLLNDCCTFPAQMFCGAKELSITVCLDREFMTLVDAQSNCSYKFQYFINQPAVEMNPKDSSRIGLVVPGHHAAAFDEYVDKVFHMTPQQRIIDLKFVNRISRDTFLFSFKALAAKRELLNSQVIQDLMLAKPVGSTFDYLLEIQALRFDLSRFIVLNQQLAEQKQFYKTEVHRLQEEMHNIKETYTKLIQQHETAAKSPVTSPGIQAPDTTHNKPQSYPVPQPIGNSQGPGPIHQAFNEDYKEGLDFDGASEIKPRVGEQPAPQIKVHHSADTEARHENGGFNKKFINFEEYSPAAQKLVRRYNSIIQEEQEYEKSRLEVEAIIHNINESNSYVGTKELDKLQATVNTLLKQNQVLRKELQVQTEKAVGLMSMEGQIKEIERKLFEVSQECDKKREHNLELTMEVLNLKTQQGKPIPENNSDSIASTAKLSKQLEIAVHLQQKYKKKYQEAVDENKLLRKGQSMLNKSRDLSSQMDSYYEQENKIVRQQNELLTAENQRLTKLCQKYLAQAREARRLKGQVPRSRIF